MFAQRPGLKILGNKTQTRLEGESHIHGGTRRGRFSGPRPRPRAVN
jgi:hypothetical protein